MTVNGKKRSNSVVAAPPPTLTDELPLSDRDFEALLGTLGPFEQKPHLAVAVSGGADSMALALLAESWARRYDGHITALTVDHRLRADSAEEAQQVGRWMAARGIEHRILVRDGPLPTGDIQSRARAARYNLLTSWCAAHGVLHLLTAHHLDDQAETFLLRLARGSGLFGLSAMPALRAMRNCQILRPLLPVASNRLRARLTQDGQPWIEDPSNHNPRFARVGMRQAAPALAALGLDNQRLAETSRHLGHARRAAEAVLERLMAAAVTLDPAGFAIIEPAILSAAPQDSALRVLRAVLMTIGGATMPPRAERIAALLAVLRQHSLARGRTLGGCRIVPYRTTLLIYREAAAVVNPVPLQLLPGGVLDWDGRFEIRDISGKGLAAAEVVTIAPLGADARLLRPLLADVERQIPFRTWSSLPVFKRQDTILGVQPLCWIKAELAPDDPVRGLCVSFQPRHPLNDCAFTVV